MNTSMKTTLAATLLILLLAGCHKVHYEGQTGRIVHTKFDPPININFNEDHPASGWDTIYFDFDDDGIRDMMIYFAYPYLFPAFAHALDSWQLGFNNDDIPVNEWNQDLWVQRTHLDPAGKYYLRNKIGDDYCYGWIHSYMMYGDEGQHPVTRFYFKEYAYCTCPNYPIKWGE